MPWTSFSHLLCLHQAPFRNPPHVTSFLCPAMQDPQESSSLSSGHPSGWTILGKYGFGYQLSDGGNRVLVRDSSTWPHHPGDRSWSSYPLVPSPPCFAFFIHSSIYQTPTVNTYRCVLPAGGIMPKQMNLSKLILVAVF